MYLKKIKIGNVELENNIILAPMAGVTDLPFRIICKKYGNPGLVCNEMVSSRAICYKDEKTLNMIKSNNEKDLFQCKFLVTIQKLWDKQLNLCVTIQIF